VKRSEFEAHLAEARTNFRARIERGHAPQVWENFGGRIAAVLSGGGARGAYEAGVLLAFQDACLPTHLITATSVGSLNAESYAAHSTTLVGDAEPLTKAWFELTPAVVGIEWTRYVWLLAGLIAASAGFGNLIRYALDLYGFGFSLHDPALTWFSLGLVGVVVLLLRDRLPYLGYVVRNWFRGTSWGPDTRKIAQSLGANLVVWGFLVLLIHSLHLPVQFVEFVRARPRFAALGAAALVLLLAAGLKAWRALSRAHLYKFLRLPLGTGLFANFERSRFLRQRISNERLRASPIRVIFTAADLEGGTARFFSNTPVEQLLKDPGAEAAFISQEVSTTGDLLRAAIASSALPIAFEPIRLDGRLYTDGAVIVNQPIRPAIRLGADVLFLVILNPPGSRVGEAKSFIDVGLRSLDILMSQNLLTDLKVLINVNAMCERAAAELGLGPEEIEIDLGTRHYRFVKAFTIQPDAPLGGTVLDFGGEMTAPSIRFLRNRSEPGRSRLHFRPS